MAADFPAKAMILAAGRGNRLRPLTDQVPKCMVPIGRKPLLEYTIERFAFHGVKEIVMNLHHLPDTIMDHFQDGQRWGVKITYSMERELLGTAGGVRNVASFFDGPFIVWYGDNLSRCDLNRMWRFHSDHCAVGTIALFEREEVSQSGIVGIDSDGRIERFHEKPHGTQVFSNLVNAGIYIFDRGVFDWIPKTGASDFAAEVFPLMLSNQQPLFGYRLSREENLWWIDRPEDLSRVEHEWELQ